MKLKCKVHIFHYVPFYNLLSQGGECIIKTRCYLPIVSKFNIYRRDK
jgi:hypothetical protein